VIQPPGDNTPISAFELRHLNHLTIRWSQPLAVVKSTFDCMKQFLMFSALAAASGG
jgi:hypothetical protein